LKRLPPLKLHTGKYLKIQMRHKKLTLKIMLEENPQTTVDKKPVFSIPIMLTKTGRNMFT